MAEFKIISIFIIIAGVILLFTIVGTWSITSKVRNKTNRDLAVASLIMGLLGCILPYTLYSLFGLLDGLFPNGIVIIPGIDTEIFVLLISFAVSLAGPVATIVGMLAFQKQDPADTRETWKIQATAGIVLGILTLLCVLLPLMLFLPVGYIIAGGF
jgi:hypothetical protein